MNTQPCTLSILDHDTANVSMSKLPPLEGRPRMAYAKLRPFLYGTTNRWWRTSVVSQVEVSAGDLVDEWEVSVDEIAALADMMPCRWAWQSGEADPEPFELFCYVSAERVSGHPDIKYVTDEGLASYPDVSLEFGYYTGPVSWVSLGTVEVFCPGTSRFEHSEL